MVKIGGYDPRLNQIPGRKPGRTKPTNRAEFVEALQRADTASQSVNEITKLSQVDLQKIYGPVPTGAIDSTTPTDVQATAQGALDLLDAFAQALADPGRTLKSMADLVQGLEAEARRIEHLSATLPEGDQGRALLDQIGSRAMIEAIKFNRGDYI